MPVRSLKEKGKAEKDMNESHNDRSEEVQPTSQRIWPRIDWNG